MKKKITIVPYVDVSDSEITEWNDGDSFDASAEL